MRYSRIAFLALTLVLLVLVSACTEDDVVDGRRIDFYAEEPFAFEVDVTTQTVLRLEGVNGRIQITGVDGSSVVDVTGVRKVGSDTMEDAEEHLADLTVVHGTTDTEVSIATEQPQFSDGRLYTVDYVVEIPRGLAVIVLAVNGEFVVTGVQANVVVNGVNGSIEIADVLGDAGLALVNGEIVASLVMLVGGGVDVEIVNGSIELSIPQDTSATVDAEVANGTVSWSNLDFSDLGETRRSLTGTLGDGDGTITLNAVNGPITIRGI